MLIRSILRTLSSLNLFITLSAMLKIFQIIFKYGTDSAIERAFLMIDIAFAQQYSPLLSKMIHCKFTNNS